MNVVMKILGAVIAIATRDGGDMSVVIVNF